LEGSIFTSGIIYRWFRDQFGTEEKVIARMIREDAYRFLNEQANLSEPGARGVLLLPHFAGAGAPYWNPLARGVILGLALGHKRHDIIRAIIEGTAFEVRRTLEVLQSLGVAVKEVRLTGGATRSSVWNQIQADINNLPMLRGEVEEATALGAAILASVGAGIHQDVETAAETMVRTGEHYLPNKEFQKRYDRLYSIQSDAYTALEKAKIFDKLAELE
jgi:xylulokinase